MPTLRALLQDEVLGRTASDDELVKLKSDYNKLSPTTARKVLKFWSGQPAAVSPDAGHGPRHMVFSPNGKNLYVLNELSGHVTQYAIDAGKGTLTLVDSISSVPKEAGLAWGTAQAPLPRARSGQG